MKPNDTGRFAYNYLIQKGLSPVAAAGIVGNLAIESGNFSPAVIAGEKRGDNGTAAYAQQLRGERLTNYRKFVRERGLAEDDLRAQLDFALEEKNPNSPYADSIAAQNRDQILNAADPESSARAFMNFYERPNKDPKINHVDKRVAYANSLIGMEGPVSDAPSPSFQEFSQQTQQQTDDPSYVQSLPTFGGYGAGDGLIRAAYLMRGEAPPLAPSYPMDAPLVDASVASTPLGGYGPTDEGYSPSSIPSGPSAPLELGADAALAASTKNQFGLKATGDHVSLDGIDPQVIQAATLSANMLGFDIPVTSGYRSQAKQDRIRNGRNVPGVAKNSYHTAGTALDIPTAGLSQEQIAQMVDVLAGNGFTGFGHYGEGKHIHADFRDAVPKSFNPDTGWGGWTSIPPYMMEVLIRRGYRPGASASTIRRGFAPPA